ncbi:hypothetical protein WH43_07470 [Rheinheimera sp. KL1]|uniref:hypothetical protein n=1 Tax=Rheinheimera sp. KL1 TaxID=1635005 RepID=UPI0006A9BD9C|nr:hypothetical protein [Rheinheimera sp. KL1]KOO58685.1 hypothetical protein WH43_07470 [Rheinheimera sp. KL1]
MPLNVKKAILLISLLIVLYLLSPKYAWFLGYHVLPLIESIGVKPDSTLYQIFLYILASLFPILGLIPYFFWSKKQRDKTSSNTSLSDQLVKLGKFKSSLDEVTSYITTLQKDIEENARLQVELEEKVKILNSVATESVDTLKEKMDAISLASRGKNNKNLAISFVLGVAASLLASSIFQLLSDIVIPQAN